MTATDESLLIAFASHRDEKAFRVLADRYLGLVFHTAMRRTNQRQLAEDISQNILCALAEKASSLAKNADRLPAWLHRATLYESSKAMRAESSHQRRQLLQIPYDTAPDASAWNDAIPHLDAALETLSDADRHVVLLHFFENRSFPGIASSLGKSTVAVQKQSQRALGKLARLLRSKGVTLSATAVATGLSTEFAKAAPASFVQSATTAVLTGTATYSTTGLTLMFAAKSKVLVPIVILLCALPLVFQQLIDSNAGDAQAMPPARTKSLGADTRDSRTVSKSGDYDAMAIIREQFALAISDNPDRASLEKALAACRRLKSTSSFYELLSDPKFGWERMAPTTLCTNGSAQTFLIFASNVHQALFERWGEVDLDGALKTLKNRLLTKGRGDFDEGLAITFNLYKGAASVGDGKHVFDTLIPPASNGCSEHDSCALTYLIEGWARSDPDAAWQTLVSFPAMENAGRGAIMAYFNGLSSNTNWEELSRKVEAYCAADQFIAGKEARGEFRRSMASTWLRHDPAAALAWFASNCDDPHPNYDSNGSAWSVVSHAVIIREWLREDLAGATQWLATWQSDRIPIPEVLAKIADWQAGEEGQNGTSKITDAVRKLIELSVLEARSVGVEQRNGPVPRH